MPIYIIAYETEHETYQSFFRSGSNGMTFLLSLITGNPVKIIVNYIAMNYLISHAAINHAVTRELNTDAYQIASIQFFTFICSSLWNRRANNIPQIFYPESLSYFPQDRGTHQNENCVVSTFSSRL